MANLIERQKDMLRIIKDQKYIRIKELAKRFNVSLETVRRDIEHLEAEGHVVRSHGGVTYKVSVLQPILFNERSIQNQPEKESIARAAAELIHDNDAVVVIGATTTLCLAPFLRARNGLLLITNDWQMATIVGANSNNRVIFLGGQYIPGEFCTWGDEAVRTMRGLLPDKAFISSTGVSLKDGITSFSTEERNLLHETIERSRETYLLADHTKFEQRGLHVTCSIHKVSAIITDWKISPKLLAEFTAQGHRVISGAPIKEPYPELE